MSSRDMFTRAGTVWLEPAFDPETIEVRCLNCDLGEIPSNVDDRLMELCPVCEGTGWLREVPADRWPPV